MAETQTDREPGTRIRSLDGAETVTRENSPETMIRMKQTRDSDKGNARGDRDGDWTWR